MRDARLAEMANNPYYISAPSPPVGLEGEEEKGKKKKKKHHHHHHHKTAENNTSNEAHHPPSGAIPLDLQSPLEIPGKLFSGKFIIILVCSCVFIK